jgi:hypothetical protein
MNRIFVDKAFELPNHPAPRARLAISLVWRIAGISSEGCHDGITKPD